MAALWEGEGSEVGLRALTAPSVWDSSECFGDVSGMAVVLSCAKDLIQLMATPKPATHKFEALFDNRRLDDAGFGPRIDFEKRVKLVGAALKGDESVSATLRAESGGMKLAVCVKMAGFEVIYSLPLKRVDFDLCHILKAKLRTAEQQLLETTTRAEELQQINLELMQRMDAAVAKGDATHKQLVAATTKTEALEQQLAASKTEVAETKEELAETKEQLAVSKTENERIRAALAKLKAESREQMTRIRFRDARIRELEKVCAKPVSTTVAKISSTLFRFDTSIKSGFTNPSDFEVSADGKSANAKEYGAQMVLTPALSSDCQLKLVVEKTGYFCVGITDDYSEYVYNNGCAFDSNGDVWVNGSAVADSQPFGDWRTGDRLLLDAHLSSGTLTIESRTGKYTAKWKPTKEPIYFAVHCYGKGTALRIE